MKIWWLATYIRKRLLPINTNCLISSLCLLLLSVLEMDIYVMLAGNVNVSVFGLRHCDQVQPPIKMSPEKVPFVETS